MPPSYQSEIVATASAALLGVIGTIAITKPDLAGGAGLNEVSIDCRVEARGNSRRQCGWRPLRFHFNGDPGGTIFTGTGRFIDFVTHCGFRPGQWEGLAGSDEVEHDRRLHQEFTFYKVIRAFGEMTLETRLASVTYRDLAGTELENRFGFIRERKSRAPLRCGMQRQEEDEGDPFGQPNPTSLFQAEFHHLLIFHHDYFFPNAEHNVVDGSEDFYFPYDFDLSGVIAPQYFKNNGWSIQRNAEELPEWLRQQDESLARTQVAEVLSKEAEIRQIVAGTRADATGKSELDEWLETHLRQLKAFLCGGGRHRVVTQQADTQPKEREPTGTCLTRRRTPHGPRRQFLQSHLALDIVSVQLSPRSRRARQ